MNFKEWLSISETTIRIKPSKTPQGGTPPPVADRSTLYGLAGQLGHPGTQSPISIGTDNQAVAGALGGIGSGMAKAQEKSGFQARPISQISPFPGLVKPHIVSGYLPLQVAMVPSDGWLPGFNPNSLQSYDSDISKQVFSHIRDPENDSRVRKENDDPKDRNKFATLNMMGSSSNNLLGHAKNFTRALIKISIINKMMKEGLDKEYNLAKGKLEKEHEEGNILVCVFSFQPYKSIDKEEGN